MAFSLSVCIPLLQGPCSLQNPNLQLLYTQTVKSDVRITDWNANQNEIDRFVLALFERKFDFKQDANGGDGSGNNNGNMVGKLVKSPLLDANDALTPFLDSFLKFFREESLDSPFVGSLLFVAKNTSKPSLETNRNATINSPVLTLAVLGLCDVWSAIRKYCAKKLGSICFLNLIDIKQVELLYFQLMSIAVDTARTWQEIEGSLHGLDSILSGFIITSPSSISNIDISRNRKTSFLAIPTFLNSAATTPSVCSVNISMKNNNNKTDFKDPEDFEVWKDDNQLLKFGSYAEILLPACFTEPNCKILLFQLLSHSQLSVREAAVKTFTTLLSRCNEDEWNLVFLESLNKLLTSQTALIDACEAEGLLALCASIISPLRANFVQNNWEKIFTVLDRYLSHPASTVRQVVSSLFLKLALKSNPSLPSLTSSQPLTNVNSLFLRLVLQSLSSPWKIYENGHGEFPFRRYLPTDVEAAVHSSLPPQLPIPPTSADTLRVPKSFNTGTPVSPNVDQSFELGSNTNGLSWESKEGRLLSFELIFEKLLNSHDQVISSVDRSCLSPVGRYTFSLKKKSRRSMSVTIDPNVVNLTPEFPTHDNSVKTFVPVPPHSNRQFSCTSIPTFSLATPDSTITHSIPSPILSPFGNPTLCSTHRQKESDLSEKMYSVLQYDLLDVSLPNIDDTKYEIYELNMPSCVPEVRPPKVDCTCCAISSVFDSLSVVPFSQVLNQILVQTIECCLDSRWELRRMADQVLPLLIQVMCWFDMRRLEKIWKDYFTPEVGDFKNYIAGLSLKYALRTSFELQQLQGLDLGSDVKKVQMQYIIKSVADIIPLVIENIFSLYNSRYTDKIGTLCVEIMIMILAEFPLKVSEQCKNSLLSLVLQSCYSIFNLCRKPLHGTPSAALAAISPNTLLVSPPSNVSTPSHAHLKTFSNFDTLKLSASPVPNPITPAKSNSVNVSFSTPYDLNLAMDGILNLSSTLPRLASNPNAQVMISLVSQARKAERVQHWLLSCVHKLLPQFVNSFDALFCAKYAPLFIKWIHDYDDREMRISISKSFKHIISTLVNFINNMNFEVPISGSLEVFTFDYVLNFDSTFSTFNSNPLHSIRLCESIVSVFCTLFERETIMADNALEEEVFAHFKMFCSSKKLLTLRKKEEPTFLLRILQSISKRLVHHAPGCSSTFFSSSLNNLMKQRHVLSPRFTNPTNIESIVSPRVKSSPVLAALNILSDNEELDEAVVQPGESEWDNWDDFDSGHHSSDGGFEHLTAECAVLLKDLIYILNDTQDPKSVIYLKDCDFFLYQFEQLFSTDKDVILWVLSKTCINIFD